MDLVSPAGIGCRFLMAVTYLGIALLNSECIGV
jgi:hypothetical protein